MTKKTENLMKNMLKHPNSWVAIDEASSKILAYGKEPKDVLNAARKKGAKNPTLTKIPKNYGTYIL